MLTRARAATRLAALALGVALAAGCAGPGDGAGQLLWVGDMEAGDLAQFQDTPWNRVGGPPPTVIDSPVRSGRHAVALGITGTTTPSDGICCGSRNELLPAFRELGPGDDLYFAFSTFLEPGFPVDAEWQLITQFKQNFDGSPPLGIYVENGSYRIEGGYGHPEGPRPFEIPVGAAGTGVWVDWVLHVVFSPDPSVGSVEVWKDGQLVLPSYAPPGGTLYPGPGGVDSSYVKTGYYRNPTIDRPGTVVFDDWRIGTGLAVVTPQAPRRG